MFIESTKVKIIAADLTNKNPIEPGSIGYVIPFVTSTLWLQNQYESAFGPGQTFKLTDVYNKNFNTRSFNAGKNLYYIQPIEIFLYKVPSCEKTRSEKRVVYNVFPIFNDIKNIDINHFFEKFTPKELAHLTELAGSITFKGVNQIPSLCVAVPYLTQSPSNILKDFNEFLAWGSSVLQNPFCIFALNKVPKSHPLLNDPIITFLFAHKTTESLPTISKLKKAGYHTDIIAMGLRKLLTHVISVFDRSSCSQFEGIVERQHAASQIWRLNVLPAISWQYTLSNSMSTDLSNSQQLLLSLAN